LSEIAVRLNHIVKKVRAVDESSIINTILSADKEFGWTSNFDGFHHEKKSDDVVTCRLRAARGKRLVGGIARKDITKKSAPHRYLEGADLCGWVWSNAARGLRSGAWGQSS
jgi:hypothetical protein